MSLNLLAKGLDNLLHSDVDEDMYKVYNSPCPECIGSMLVGDYVCWGICYSCFDKKMQEYSLESST